MLRLYIQRLEERDLTIDDDVGHHATLALDNLEDIILEPALQDVIAISHNLPLIRLLRAVLSCLEPQVDPEKALQKPCPPAA